jgi:thioredoxin reductase (NADPH)
MPNSQLARHLGCELDDRGYVSVDPMGATTVDGVFAIGDLTRRGPHQIALSAADGMMTAMALTSRAAQARLTDTRDQRHS